MPYTNEFDAVCYIQNYPDLQDRATMPAQPNLPLKEQFGWMYKSTDGKWHYGRTNNRELKRIQDNAYWHWINFGMKEGRVPGCKLECTLFSPTFNANAYKQRYPDVSGLSYGGSKNPYINNPLGHWLEVGSKEGRIPGVEYLSNNCQGVSTPGTAVFVTEAEIKADFDEYNKRHLSAGTGETAIDTTGKEATDQPIQKKNNLLLYALLGIGGYFLLKNKRKNGKK